MGKAKPLYRTLALTSHRFSTHGWFLALVVFDGDKKVQSIRRGEINPLRRFLSSRSFQHAE